MRIGDIEITLKEFLFSIAICFISSGIALFLFNVLQEKDLQYQEQLNTSIQTLTEEQFKYCVKTSVGNILAFGTLKVDAPIQLENVNGNYILVTKIKEHYTMHTRLVTYRVGNTTHTRTEIYYTWDEVGKENLKGEKLFFNNVLINWIDIKNWNNLKITLKFTNGEVYKKTSSVDRYYYKGVPNCLLGSLFTSIKENTIQDKGVFYKNMTPEQVIENNRFSINKEAKFFWIIFFIFLFIFIGLFYYADNYWLNN